MTLLTPDLYRNFGIGFLAGALMVGAATIGDWGSGITSPARAAQPLEAPQPTGEFVITPLESSE